MKKPLLNYFTPDELERILASIYYSQKNGVSQNENLQLCFVTRRIDHVNGKRVTECKNCRCGIEKDWK